MTTKTIVAAISLLLTACDPAYGPVMDPPSRQDGGVRDLKTSQPDMYRCAGVMCPPENDGDVIECIDVQTDPRHCGACGVKCNSNLPDCCAGVKVNKRSNGENCGACGNVCDIDAGMYCLDGVCGKPPGIK